MLKGHVRIDIHNHNSGFTERYEQDNMVTNAMKRIIPSWMGSNQLPNDEIMPLATKALGGLMLFDGALTENANNIFFPNEAHLIACAGQDTNSTNPRRGSKNNSESKEIDTGYQTTWDFNTAQANGNIRSLALTLNQTNGDVGCRPFEGIHTNYGIHSVRRLNGDQGQNSFPLVYDKNTQTMYFIGADGYSYTSEYDSYTRKYTYTFTMTVYKEYMPVGKYKVADSANRVDYPEAVTQISYSIKDFGTDPRVYIRNGYDGYAYIVYPEQNTSGDGKFKYFKIKLSDFSFELVDPFGTTVTVASCSLAGGINSGIINNGKCILRGYNSRWLYVVDLSNPVNVRSVDLGEGYWAMDYDFTNFRNGIVKLQVVSNSSSPSRYYWFDALLYTDGWLLIDGSPYNEGTVANVWRGHARFTLITDDLLVYGLNATGYTSYGRMVNNYLGTICNLGSAIVKTAASSMKVVYTLTDVDS